ncbi:MAG TPA: BatD family protein [Oleiagrimonas sp.]|nr:BatD family protein [Oleiagrimonas sp.]
MRQHRALQRGRLRWLWLVPMACMLATSAWAGSVTVRAFLDRDHAQLGDTVTLNVEIDGTTQATAPDVSALQSDFDILGMSHNTGISIVNGQSSSKTLWAIALRPRHAGVIRIPSLTVAGQTTASLTLTVGAAPAATQGGPGQPVFIRVAPSTRTPYVGEQIDLAVRFFYASTVGNGSLSLPHGNGIDVRPLGQDNRYQVERGGRIYHVLEKHYAVIPRQAGSLELAPVTFYGTMASPGQFGGFFGNGRTVAARSKPIRLDVRARPSASGKGAWLPARKLTLSLEGLPADGQIEAGQSLTLTLTEKVTGLPFESLPEPELPALDGVDVYPDQSQDHTGDDGHWLEGTRTRKFALVPQQAGTLTIPAITLAWWNVETNQKEVARIPAHKLHVTATTKATAATPPVVSGSAMAPAVAPASSVLSPPTARSSAATPSRFGDHLLAWFALGLWLVTLLAAGGYYAWSRHRRAAETKSSVPQAPGKPDRRRQRQAFMFAAKQGDAAARCDTLLAWARSERPALRHLGDLADALEPGVQVDAIAGLQRARYGTGAPGPDADTLLAAFDKGFAWRRGPAKSAADAALPPLYPS